MITAKAKINQPGDEVAIIPIVVPDLDEVRAFAAKLHTKGEPWIGEAFGWQAEYNPESATPPLDSNLTFTPADFVIGINGIWFFSLMWEHGKQAPPVEFLDNRNIIAASAT